MIEDFIILSEILTGEDALDYVLAGQYFERLQKEDAAKTDLISVMERFSQIRAAGGTPEEIVEAVEKQIVTNAALKTIAGRIIFLWYTGAIKNGDESKYGSAEQFFSGLFWEVVRAHPPALSGGYFGYWKYPPEN